MIFSEFDAPMGAAGFAIDATDAITMKSFFPMMM